MYCKNCGSFIDPNSDYCTNCGMRINRNPNYDPTDSSSFGFTLLGFFIPLAGPILFLVFENNSPKRAKSAGKGALIGFITRIVLSIIIMIIYCVFAFSILKGQY